MTPAQAHRQLLDSPAYECRRGPGGEAMLLEAGTFIVTDDRGRNWCCIERTYGEMAATFMSDDGPIHWTSDPWVEKLPEFLSSCEE